MIVSPSILNSDFLHLGQQINLLNNSHADWIHLDIMDGVFVPNISFGFPIIRQIKKAAKKPLDVHLMIVDPDRYINECADCGAEILTVHYEACTHLHRTLQQIKNAGMKAGVSLNPHTPVHLLDEIISMTDMVLIMSVNPGFGGQQFIEQSYKKIQLLKQLIIEHNASTLIQVDGGVSVQNAEALKKAGVDVLVCGSAIFQSSDPNVVIDKLKSV